MTSAPTGRSSNPYATYVDLDAAEQPQNEYPPPPPPPPPAYLPPPPPPPVAYFLPPEKPEKPPRRVLRKVGKYVALVATAFAILLGYGVVRAWFDEGKQKEQACSQIGLAAQDLGGTHTLPNGTTRKQAATVEEWTAVLTSGAPIDPTAADEQLKQDSHNRRFAGSLAFNPSLKAALIGIADDVDGLIAVRQDTTTPVAERAQHAVTLTASLDGHMRDAQSACGQAVTGIIDRP
ncbi:hypothetical protein [Dactylosporangium sp. CS-033363]|uniref:hypothetical protein n=1 Tax=Dactylosporangium sp. CS-033363 TaxID=3239935 RepID=UPI003D9285E4